LEVSLIVNDNRYTRQAEKVFASSKVGPFILAVPTTPMHWTVDEMLADPIVRNSRLGLFTHCGNVLDLCGVSVPAGTYPLSELKGKAEPPTEPPTEAMAEVKIDGEKTKEGKEGVLPFAITLLGGSRTDAEVLEVARRFEAAVNTKAWC
jgi:Asp-tRNA(Asn)/Glu-tRNA(Gln) amidotransferase A subunit family amidase